jgi:hypothetical protein
LTVTAAPHPPISIADALRDPRLFGPLFPGPTWRAWMVFLQALFGLTMGAEDLVAYRHHTGRSSPPTAPFRECALVIGRRGGKSRVLALIAVYLACFVSYAAYLVAGETGVIAIVASDRRQARVLLRYVVGTLRAVPSLAAMIETELAESVALTNGIAIEIHTGTISSPRGRTFIAVLCDEIAFWRSDDSVNPDAEVIAAVRPGLASIPTSMLLMASSPYRKGGVLYNAFKRHFGRDDSRTLIWRGATLEMNPALDPVIIAEAREEDPQAASSEYDAQFRDDIAAFVAREVIDACTVPGRFELPPMTGAQYVAYTDPSGGSSDSMTLCVAHQEQDRTILDALREVRPPFSPESVVRDFATLLKTYHVSTVRGDRYAGEWPRERFREHGIEYKLSDRPASDLFRDILPLLNSARIELLDLPRLTTQFSALERRTTRNGRDSISHPPGGHDDAANAAAGALLEAARRPVQAAKIAMPFVFTSGARLFPGSPAGFDDPEFAHGVEYVG